MKRSANTRIEDSNALIGTKVAIVNPESLTQCQPHEVGEIWVAGETVARGYWNRPEETEKTFQAYVSDI